MNRRPIERYGRLSGFGARPKSPSEISAWFWNSSALSADVVRSIPRPLISQSTKRVCWSSGMPGSSGGYSGVARIATKPFRQ